jgi:hypothetical protein
MWLWMCLKSAHTLFSNTILVSLKLFKMIGVAEFALYACSRINMKIGQVEAPLDCSCL